MLKGSNPRKPTDLVAWAVEFLSEFQCTQRTMTLSGMPTTSINCTDWIPPYPNALKLNTDVAIRKGALAVGLGATIIDDKR